MTLTADTRTEVLTDEMLARFDQRAPQYDPANQFFDEDFEELRRSGYLLASVPTDLGGGGLSLAEINRLQRRIAYVAPATAVAINMHHYFVGLCADLHRSGDPSGDWVLQQAAAGHVFAAGHGEAGNDIPVLLSSAKAERVDGGLGVHRPQDLRQPVAGVDLPRRPRHGHERSCRAEGRSRLRPPRHAGLPDRADVGHARHARHDVQRHDPRPHVRAR